MTLYLPRGIHVYTCRAEVITSTVNIVEIIPLANVLGEIMIPVNILFDSMYNYQKMNVLHVVILI